MPARGTGAGRTADTSQDGITSVNQNGCTLAVKGALRHPVGTLDCASCPGFSAPTEGGLCPAGGPSNARLDQALASAAHAASRSDQSRSMSSLRQTKQRDGVRAGRAGGLLLAVEQGKGPDTPARRRSPAFAWRVPGGARVR
jgi:hypothetical protein